MAVALAAVQMFAGGKTQAKSDAAINVKATALAAKNALEVDVQAGVEDIAAQAALKAMQAAVSVGKASPSTVSHIVIAVGLGVVAIGVIIGAALHYGLHWPL